MGGLSGSVSCSAWYSLGPGYGQTGGWDDNYYCHETGDIKATLLIMMTMMVVRRRRKKRRAKRMRVRRRRIMML